MPYVDPGFQIRPDKKQKVYAPQQQNRQSAEAPDTLDFSYDEPIRALPEPKIVSGTNKQYQLDNYDKLTNTEKFILNALPRVASSKFGELMSKFAESPFGKVLNWIDYPAEVAERAVGTVSQYLYNEGEDFKLRDAWNAGSLWADTINLPTFKRNEEGNITGLSIPNDLPGQAYLADARRKIAGGVPLETVRNEYYDSLGALQIRAQMYDTYFHIAADPLNYIAPAIKPADRIAAASAKALTRVPQSKLDDIARIVSKADELIEAAEKAGDLLAKEKHIASKAIASQLLERKTALGAQTNFDKVLLYMRGNPLKPDAEITGKLESALRSKYNPFALNPESRAIMAADNVRDAINTYIIAPALEKAGDSVDEGVAAIRRAAKAAVNDELAPIMVTADGRHLQGYIGGADAVADAAHGSWLKMEEPRGLMRIIADTLDDNPKVIASRVAGNIPEAKKILLQADEVGQTVRISAEELSDIGAAMKGMPFTKEEFFYQLMNDIGDHAAKIAIVQFGVKRMGIVRKLARATKAVETLAFLRINPGFLVRNLINNEFTMIARGAWGWTGKQVDEFWELAGKTRPSRLSDAFRSAVDELGQPVTDKAAGVINDALLGEAGYLDKISSSFNELEFGVLDMGQWSTKIEAHASKRAFTSGYVHYMRRYGWKPGKGYDRLTDFIASDAFDYLKVHDADLVRHIENRVRDMYKNPNVNVYSGSLDNSISSLLDDVSSRTGLNARDYLPDEVIIPHEEALRNAIDEGRKLGKTEPIERAINNIRNAVEDHVEEMWDKRMANLVDEVREKVKLTGPSAITEAIGSAMDSWNGAHAAYAMEMSRLKAMADGVLDSKAWKVIDQRNTKYWNRQWDRLDGVFKGISEGLDGSKGNKPLKEFDNWRGGWKEFFDKRRKLHQQYFEANDAGKTPKMTWKQITEERTRLYKKAMAIEEKAMKSIDTELGKLLPADLRKEYAAWRKKMFDLRKADQQETLKFWEKVDSLKHNQVDKAFSEEYWPNRYKRMVEMSEMNKSGFMAMMGDEFERAKFTAVAATDAPVDMGRIVGEEGLITLQDEYRRLLDIDPDDAAHFAEIELENALRRYIGQSEADLVPDGDVLTELTGDVTDELAGVAPDATGAGLSAEQILAEVEELGYESWDDFVDAALVGTVTKPEGQRLALPSADYLTRGDEPPPMIEAFDEFFYQHGNRMVDELEISAKNTAQKSGISVEDLPDNVQAELARYLEHVRGQFSDTQSAAIKFAEFRRDSALLNYSRRTNFDTWLGTIAPFSFWTTHSILNWVLHSVDRPAMLSTFLRMNKMMRTAGMQENGFPSRLKNTLRIPMPFLPEWMGDEVFFNPITAALPFETFYYPWERKGQIEHQIEGRAARIIEALVEADEITEQEAEQAIASQSGSIWNDAVKQVQENDANLKFDSFDFFSLLTPPHAPLVWGHEVLRGTPERIGPATPMQRTLKGVYGAFGLDWNDQWYNVEGQIRKHYGLPAFDQWEEYRIDRMLSNMAADGLYSTDDILTAMIEREGKAFDEAVRRANKEYAVSSVGGLIGIPTKAYPPGEKKQRQLQEEFNKAYKRYLDEEDPTALREFYDKYPEYETRQALFKSPEERVRSFVSDELWDTYNKFTSLNKREMKEQLGVQFEEFLDGNTESVPTETLQLWLKLVGGNPPGTMQADMLGMYANQLEFTNEEDSFLYQRYYEIAEQRYPNYWDLLQKFYDGEISYDDSEELQGYFDYRKQFFNEYPHMVPHFGSGAVQSYLVDGIWEKYMDLPKLQREQLTEQLGPTFELGFLEKDTRNYGAVTTDQLATWYKQLGGTLPDALDIEVIGIDWVDPQIAWQTQTFYDMRNSLFRWDALRDVQNEYYDLPDDKRRQFREQHPELIQYWDWRRDFITRNPKSAPYLTDTPENYEKKPLTLGGQVQPFNFTAQEWAVTLPQPIYQSIVTDGIMTEADYKQTERIAALLGVDLQTMISMVLASQP